MERPKKKIGIIGGGIQGLTIAYFLSKDPAYEVTLFERSKTLGGLLGLLEIGGTPIEGFYHHWFTSHHAVLNLARELGLEKDLLKIPNTIGTFYDGRIYPFTTALDLLRFSAIPLFSRIRLGLAALFLKLLPRPLFLDRVNAEKWLKLSCGQKAYDIVWEPLLEGKFGRDKHDISMAWFWGRVHERGNSPILIYPDGGFKKLIDAMVLKIKNAGNHLLTGASIDEVSGAEGGGVLITADGKKEKFDAVFATTPIHVFLKMTKGLPGDYIKDLGRIRYRGAHVTIMALKRSLLPEPFYWVNINDRSIPLLAVIEHTHLIPKERYSGKNIVYLGNYPDPDDPIMSMPDGEVIDLYAKNLIRLNPEFKKEWIEEFHIFKDRSAQPVVDTAYKTKIPPRQTPIKGLYLITMAQIYPWDRGTSNAVAQAKDAVSLLKK